MNIKKIAIYILITIALIGSATALNYYTRFYKPNTVRNEEAIRIYRKTDYNGLLDTIRNSGVLKNFKSFKRAAEKLKLASSFKPGLYRIKDGLNNKEVIRIFAYGWQTPENLTISGNIRNREKLASLLGSKLEADSASFIKALNDTSIMRELGFKSSSYLSMIIPDTYEMYWTISPEDFLRRMKKEYDAFWNKERTSKAAEIKLSKEEVSSLASIVIEETKYVPEMPVIAGVYMNRIKKGMPLQADPTVKFALNDPSVRRILNKHLLIDSPYNTYKYRGLPPGPITIPSIASLDAVLNYQNHNYLYFCAKDTFNGQHSFSSSYIEHLKNARAYQRAFKVRQSVEQQK